jgi:putative ATP-dependent endonuclease of OLD family
MEVMQKLTGGRMQINKIQVKNFRLLKAVELILDKQTTLIVGRNNSGKTSLAELFRRLLSDSSVNFLLEDFSIASHGGFWNAYELSLSGADDLAIRAALPVIEVAITLTYEATSADLGTLSDFIIDLNPACIDARVEIRYEVGEGKLKALFGEVELDAKATLEIRKAAFLQQMKELVPKYFTCNLAAVDPNDPANRKSMEWSKFRALVQGDLVAAHRGLDDVTHKDNDSLGKILSALFVTAESEVADAKDKKTVSDLKSAVKDVQSSIDKSFNTQLTSLLPTLGLFGYRLPDPKIRTETLLDVALLLKNHTKIRYSGVDGVHLPESYNGLGARNLIFIILRLFEAFKSYLARKTEAGVHLVFIEEPEAHLHPQMQEVFIQKLGEMAELFAKTYGGGRRWPVQFVVTTHSSYMANKAPFDATRYFLTAPDAGGAPVFSTRIKDLKRDFGDKSKDDNDFLHQYMTQTRCDLLFADKVILIEGTTERLLLPKIIEKLDSGTTPSPNLGSQYLAVLEVGGAYSHKFFKLLDFLELPALIITDIDAVGGADGSACKVSAGTATSNASIRSWFEEKACTPKELLAKTDAEKTKGQRRIAYQVPEAAGKASGRSFEDAFMLANPGKFGIETAADIEHAAYTKASSLKKSEFALKHAITVTDWQVPRYMSEGLVWLAGVGTEVPAPTPPALIGKIKAKAKPKSKANAPVAATVVTVEVTIPKESDHGG